ncbi:MAG: CsgG/HfaB family protein [Deltaproteobacteria bacterium]|nr:CsgG/HfaB family protein [Deltaproteobacteria bacterium]
MIRVINFANLKKLVVFSLILFFFGCTPGSSLTYYHDPNMDFAAIRSVAIMPFENLTREPNAAERVRDVFANSLLSTGAVYVIPLGEVARGIARAGILNPAVPSMEEIGKFAGIIRVDAVITGTVTEYGEVRSGNASANIISMNVQMIEVQALRIVWTASATKGGISIWDRLLGAGGKPMNEVTMKAVTDVLDKLFI